MGAVESETDRIFSLMYAARCATYSGSSEVRIEYL
jgi:hypothetical protein